MQLIKVGEENKYKVASLMVLQRKIVIGGLDKCYATQKMSDGQ